MPKYCPCCHTLVVHTEEEVAVRCPNKECPEQKLGRLIFFVSKDAMDIGHLGEKALEQLFTRKLVQTPADIYRLTVEDLEKLEGFKEKSIRNVMQSIEASKQCTLARLILALGIKYVGEGTAEDLAEAARDMPTLMQMSEEQLLEIDGVGEKVAKAVFEFFQQEENRKEIRALQELGVRPKTTQFLGDPTHLFYGKTFVLTGTLAHYTRSQASMLIKEKGGKVAATVSSKIDYLLVGEDPGSKVERAQKLHVPLMTEEEFQRWIR
ncbi:MAG: hypothetical protein FJZ58_06660 [Chlamydiae bacterium]|nr:hypothetical protein [Chlamydiota bacterium]